MNICERAPGDLKELKRLVRIEKHADRRDRLRAVVLAIEGEDSPSIARLLGRSRRQVQHWAYAYRGRGRGRDAGPTSPDKACALRGKDVQRILREEFGVTRSPTAADHNLHRLGCSCLAPRPRHEKQDLQAQRQFKYDSAPLL